MKLSNYKIIITIILLSGFNIVFSQVFSKRQQYLSIKTIKDYCNELTELGNGNTSSRYIIEELFETPDNEVVNDIFRNELIGLKQYLNFVTLKKTKFSFNTNLSPQSIKLFDVKDGDNYKTYFIIRVNKKVNSKNGSSYFAINPSNRKIINIYDNVPDWVMVRSKDVDLFSGKFVFAFRNNKTKAIGYLNQDGDVVIKENKYNTPFSSDGYAVFYKDGKYGIINSNGKIIVGPKYHSIYEPQGNFFHGKGKLFINGILKVGCLKDVMRLNNFKFGFINTQGVEVVECQYDYVSNFNEGYALVQIGKYKTVNGRFVKPKNFRRYYIDTLGSVKITVPKSHLESYYFSDGLAKFINKGGKKGFINKYGKVVIRAKFAKCESFNNGRAVVSVGEKCGVINTKENFIVKPIYDDYRRKGNIVIVKKNNKWGGINLNGDILFPFVHKKSYDIDVKSEIIISKNENNQYAIYTHTGDFLVPYGKYDIIDEDNCVGYIPVKKNGKWGLIDSEENIKLPFECDTIIRNTDKGILVIKNNRFFYEQIYSKEKFEFKLIDSSIHNYTFHLHSDCFKIDRDKANILAEKLKTKIMR